MAQLPPGCEAGERIVSEPKATSHGTEAIAEQNLAWNFESYEKRPEAGRPALVDLLRLRSATFKKRFEATAMGWRGAAVLRRNAAVALGNALDRSAVEPLAESLCTDPHPMVRGHAAWALGRIGSPAALAALRGRSNVEASDEVRAEISMALQPFHSEPGVCSNR